MFDHDNIGLPRGSNIYSTLVLSFPAGQGLLRISKPSCFSNHTRIDAISVLRFRDSLERFSAATTGRCLMFAFFMLFFFRPFLSRSPVHSLPHLTVLSLSGCSKVTDDGVELIAENLQKLRALDLSWCPRITDAALEYIACDLNQLEELTLDR